MWKYRRESSSSAVCSSLHHPITYRFVSLQESMEGDEQGAKELGAWSHYTVLCKSEIYNPRSG